MYSEFRMCYFKSFNNVIACQTTSLPPTPSVPRLLMVVPFRTSIDIKEAARGIGAVRIESWRKTWRRNMRARLSTPKSLHQQLNRSDGGDVVDPLFSEREQYRKASPGEFLGLVSPPQLFLSAVPIPAIIASLRLGVVVSEIVTVISEKIVRPRERCSSCETFF